MSSRSRATSRSRFEIDGRDYYREPARRHEHDDVEVRIRERSRSRDRLPSFMRDDRRPEAGPLVLRQREVEERVLRRRSPSPVRLRETRIVRARSVSPVPPRRIEENVRYRNVERVREPSRGPDIERLRARIIDRSSSSSSSPSPPPAVDRVRARFVERRRSPSPVRERIRIIEKKEEKVRQRSPSPERIKGPIIEREVITHYRDIDHGVVQVRPPSPPPPIRRREQDRDTEIDIDIRRSHSHSRARGRSRSRSRERVSNPHHSHSWDKELVVHSESKHLHVDVEARRSHSRHRRAHSEALPYRDDRDYLEARELTSRIDSRGKMGEARNGITKDWTIIDVPPGTERVRMDGAGGGAAEVTWQKYSGVRRSRFIPDRDEKSVVSSSTSLSEHTHGDSRRGSRLSVSIIDKEKDIDRRPTPQRSEMWTEITKDLVIREAIEEMGYEYEETEWFFYVMTYLRYEDVLHLVQLSDGIRRARKERKERVAEIQWERGYQDDWDREYRIHAHSHHHDGRRRRYDDDDYVEREISYESRGSRHYHS